MRESHQLMLTTFQETDATRFTSHTGMQRGVERNLADFSFMKNNLMKDNLGSPQCIADMIFDTIDDNPWLVLAINW